MSDGAKRDDRGRFAPGTAIVGVPFQPGNSGGRKSSYDPSIDDLARRFCLLTNATDEMLAEFLGVSTTTLTNWKKKHPSFLAAVRLGKEEADMSVAEAANFAATGGTVYEQQAIKVRVGKGQEDVKVVEVARYVPPNVQAQRMWLMNRSRHWKPEGDQPDPKPSQIVNNTTINNTTVIVAKVHDELSEIFGDALPGETADDAKRVN